MHTSRWGSADVKSVTPEAVNKHRTIFRKVALADADREPHAEERKGQHGGHPRCQISAACPPWLCAGPRRYPSCLHRWITALCRSSSSLRDVHHSVGTVPGPAEPDHHAASRADDTAGNTKQPRTRSKQSPVHGSSRINRNIAIVIEGQRPRDPRCFMGERGRTALGMSARCDGLVGLNVVGGTGFIGVL